MKLTIDFTNKVVTVEHQCTADELFTQLQKIFPNDEWKEYKIEAPIQYVNYPTWIPYVPSIPCIPPYNPYPTYTTESGTTLTDCIGVTSGSTN